MSLITMGLGHFTIITMGLGNSIRTYSQQFVPFMQYGEVEFEKVDTTVQFDKESADIEFDKSKGIEYG